MTPSTLLDGNPYFDFVPEPHRPWLAERCVSRKIQRKQALFREGERSHHLHVVRSGFVKVCKEMPDGTTVLLRVFGPGESIAEIPTLTGSPYPATAIALVETELTLLPAAALTELRGRVPEFGGHSIRIASNRTCVLTERIMELALPSVEAKLAAFFVRLLDFSMPENGLLRIPIPLTREELATAAHTHTETATRILCHWEREGWVMRTKPGFLVQDRKRLESLCGLKAG